jgi:hypothetical protein
MNITIDSSGEGARICLESPEDFMGFAVIATGPEAGFAEAVSGIGTYDGTHVFVRPDALCTLAGDLAQDPDWRAQLSGMLAYAKTKGWLDEHGAIQAHVERA